MTMHTLPFVYIPYVYMDSLYDPTSIVILRNGGLERFLGGTDLLIDFSFEIPFRIIWVSGGKVKSLNKHNFVLFIQFLEVKLHLFFSLFRFD